MDAATNRPPNPRALEKLFAEHGDDVTPEQAIAAMNEDVAWARRYMTDDEREGARLEGLALWREIQEKMAAVPESELIEAIRQDEEWDRSRRLGAGDGTRSDSLSIRTA